MKLLQLLHAGLLRNCLDGTRQLVCEGIDSLAHDSPDAHESEELPDHRRCSRDATSPTLLLLLLLLILQLVVLFAALVLLRAGGVAQSLRLLMAMMLLVLPSSATACTACDPPATAFARAMPAPCLVCLRLLLAYARVCMKAPAGCLVSSTGSLLCTFTRLCWHPLVDTMLRCQTGCRVCMHWCLLLQLVASRLLLAAPSKQVQGICSGHGSSRCADSLRLLQACTDASIRL
jgi:hypothetical protein